MEITCSAELAKDLHDLGWRKETTFYYGNKLTLITEMQVGQMMGDNSYSMSPHLEVICSQNEFQMYRAKFSAPQFHEMMELLPDQIIVFDKKRNGFEGASHYWLFYKMNVDEDMNHTKHGLYHIDYSNALSRDTLEGSEFLDKNPHNAAAKLLVWCIKNKFVIL